MNESVAQTTTQDVPFVGVFRSQEQASEAVAALKAANFAENQMSVTVYQGVREEDGRVVVSVMTSDRDQEAVDILANHGANNSDLLPGTEMVKGQLILQDPQVAPPVTLEPVLGDSEDTQPDSEN